MKVNCPNCKTPLEWSSASPFRPFCSKKCQLIDLGEWANEENRIAEKSAKADLPMDIEEIEAMLSQQANDFFKK